jgi:C1A family cysteine protease
MRPAALLLVAMLILPQCALAQGAIIETMEELAGRPEPPGFRGALPAQVSLAASLPPPRDQGVAGTCTSWAATYAAASQALRRAGLGPSLKLSPSFTYNQAARDPYCRAGTNTSRTLDLLRDVGALPIEEFVYDAGWCGRMPTEAELQRAAKYKIKGWSRFDATNVEAVKTQLARGVPVVFDILMSEQLKSFKGDAVLNGPLVPSGGGHTLLAVGYDDERKAFRIQNSWGRQWGDGGYAWFSYDFWASNVHVGYVVD